ncbi:MAG: LysR substrate-binding domain-containing protein [Salinivirgaceae bacterium]|jgi:LysR family hydrogen peroxide-inducible transcriptional activator
MTLIQLEYIIAIDTYRHFVKAADHCHVTQPTLSMQIKKLEDELDIVIFDRSKQPIEPTEIGKRVIEQARLIIKNSQRITELISSTRNDISGDLRLGIIPTIASYLVPLFIPQLAEKLPLLKIYVEELMTHEVVEKLKSGAIDLGIISTPLEEEGIIETPIYYEPFVLYVSDKHKLFEKEKISSHDLKLDEMWLLSDGHCFRNHVINLCGDKHYFPKTLKFGYKTGSLEVLMKFVDQNYGYTLIPYLASLDLIPEKKNRLRMFKEPAPKREISIITPEGYLKNKLIEAIVSEIQGNIPTELRYLNQGVTVGWKA